MTVNAEIAMKDRKIPKISMHGFAERKDQIAKEIIHAAENSGFFILENQESPSVAEIEEMFALSERFFDLPEATKARTPFAKTENTGWETCSQIRPSTGSPDQKESIQLQYHRRGDRTWPEDPLIPEFQQTVAEFMEKTHSLSMNILSVFALALGFPEDFFVKSHDVNKSEAQSTIRLLHYHDITGTQFPSSYWRAGAHTDYDCLTMLFQKTGEDGLEICPGREAHTSFGTGDLWTPVKARTGEVVCNIGDMLMAWSDDRFKSLYHRVRCPGIGEKQSSRYSIAYFNQANKDVEIKGPLGKYPAMTAHKYILDATKRNYGELRR
ncbi:Clavaminate synthase-like protein [Choiromyces venosus 120613-1]|uniref:Clavaminate synthase-like protein n=1 Tax=Choiromyces venosus 120613-1 TaxID=1336337 RepID=A0A3N4J5J6_9PEZI|nr:Clavaminate synthase-like protein [Choiromyces venosus 120613-1]